ncbi:tetratricopeptide repeat protein [Methanobrevibacter sp.]
MSEYVERVKTYIEEGNVEEALKLARKRHGKDDIDSYINILNLLIDDDYLPALEEKGMYYQYYDPTHDDGDYGEKYFDEYLEKQPRSINVLCDKAMSRFNKGAIDESIDYMDKAVDKYKSYSSIEKPRLSKQDVIMARIELLIQAKRYEDALKSLEQYEKNFASTQKSDLYLGCMLQKNGENRKAIEYLDKSILEEDTLIAYNAKGDALYELKEYKEALKCYKHCLQYESKIDDNDLELKTNFNYKAAYCCINLDDEAEAVKYLNKTINMLNEHGRLPNDIENIYRECSFEKERIMKTGKVEDKEFKQSKFFSAKTSIIVLIIIIILYIILRMLGYG